MCRKAPGALYERLVVGPWRIRRTSIHTSARKVSSATFVFCMFAELPLYGVLGSSAPSWCSDVFCAIAHIHSPQRGVCCVRYVASRMTPREGAGPLPVLLLDLGRLPYRLPAALLGENASRGCFGEGKGFRPCPRISPLLAGQQRPQ